MSEIEERLRLAYILALKAGHEGARVEIHMGIHVVEHLRSLMAHRAPLGQAPTCWGFPIRVRDSFEPTAVEVHTVQAVA